MSSPSTDSERDSLELSLAPQTKKRRKSIAFDSPKEMLQRKAVRIVNKTRNLLSSPSRDSDGDLPSPRGRKLAEIEALEDEDHDPSVPLLTVPCKFHEKLRGHLHVYDSSVLFTYHDEVKDEKLCATLSISAVDNLKRNGRALSVGSKKWKMNLYSLDERKKRVISLIKSLQQYSSRDGNEDTLSSERTTITDELDDFELPPEGQEYIEDPIVQAIHHKFTAHQDYEEPKDTTMCYDKVFPVPLSVITAYLFANKSNFFHGLQPPEEIVSDYGIWEIDEKANMAVKTAYFDSKKQGITISFTQSQRIHWAPDGSLIFQCDHYMRGFPSAQNMLMSSIWKLTAQGSGSRIVAYALVVFTGFFLGKDRARRESIEGVADACQKTEEKLTFLLGLNNPEQVVDEIAPKIDSVSSIQKILQEVEVMREYFVSVMAGVGPVPQTTQIMYLLYTSLVIQIVMVFAITLRWLF